jgi:hypothetical protein
MPVRQITIAKREQAATPDPLILEINGEQFLCQSTISDFVIMELAAMGATQGQDADIMDTSSAFMGFLADIFVPEDLQRFKSLARREKWSVEDLLPLVQEAVEWYTARPTGPLSSLPGGEPTTTIASKVVDLATGTVTAADEMSLEDLIRA